MKLPYFKHPLCIAMGIALSAGVMAEENSVARKGAAAMMLEEIQVTARKKSGAESAQDVPISISAYGADQIDAMYLKDVRDMRFTTPNVQTDESGTIPGVQNFTIRGQGINSSIPSVDPTVGLFVDGMFYGVSHGAIMDMFDIESVEVLRGPQGLLFGRNVTGGAMVLRSARPDGEFGYKVRSRLSTGLEKNIAGSVEGGLTDSLAGKVTLYYNDDDGYWEATSDIDGSAYPAGGISNPAKAGDDIGKSTTQFARGTLVWTPSEDLDVTLITEKGDMDGDGPVFQSRVNVSNGVQDKDEGFADEIGFADIEWQSAVLEANWSIGSGVLTNILGYRDLESATRVDIDGISASIFNAAATTEQDQISNELRYAFSTDDYDITTGLYYFQQDIGYREQRWVSLTGAPSGVSNTVNLGGDMDHETWGAFVSGDYRLSDSVTLTAGLRYTREEKDAQVVNADPSAGGTSCVGDISASSCSFDNLNDTWENWTPKLGVNWLVGDDTMLYASYSKGFRSGGVNFRNGLPSVINPGPTKEEEQDAYEIGFKSTLMDGRLRVNGAAFYTQVSDMQRELNVGAAELPIVFTSGLIVWQATVNAGDVDMSGAELDATWLITDNFSINGSLAYMHSEYKSYDSEIESIQNDLGVTLIGTDLPRLYPKTASIGATYDMDLGDHGTLTFRGNYSYRSAGAQNDSNSVYFDDLRNANANIQWTSADAHWTVSAFGKNLNNELVYAGFNVSGVESGATGKGRVYGVEATYTY